ncbi:MAG TPA: DUF488 domain-containing protein [Candidatus Bathyarchaeia archaeon]|nr:DUF488 domain-containing protein [Candidatus Bathyarchaeia archaeon]
MTVTYSIGHSNRSLHEFIAVLSHYTISSVVDVRSHPHSRANPHFNKEVLEYELPRANIDYTWMGTGLGGFRPQTLKDSPNTAWRVKGFKNYADYALTDAFSDALSELIALATTKTLACMCAEVLWTRCHRRIIADYLLVRGWEISHILNASRSSNHQLTPFAKVDGTRVIYPSSLLQYSLEAFEPK